MSPVPRKMSNEDNDLIKEFLDNGGTVDKKSYGERSEEIEFTGGFYHRKRKKKEEESKDD